MHNRKQKGETQDNLQDTLSDQTNPVVRDKEEREIEVQKVIDQTLIREIEYLLAFLVFIFVAYLIHVIVLVSKPPV